MIRKKYSLAVCLFLFLAIMISLAATNSLINKELEKALPGDFQEAKGMDATTRIAHQQQSQAIASGLIDPDNDFLAPMKRNEKKEWKDFSDPFVSEIITPLDKTPFLVQ